jgi:hypothetical protein
MSNLPTVKGKVTFILLWISISTLGWILSPIIFFYPTLRTYLEVANRALAYAGCGLIIGLVLGIGQSLVLKQKLSSFKNWFVMTLAGYTLAWPIGLAISTIIPAIAFAVQGSSFLPLLKPTNTDYFPFPTDIMLAGWVIGIAQWTALRQILPYRNSRLAALWVLGVWLSIGLGVIVALIGRVAPININPGLVFDTTTVIDRVKIGLTSGFISGLLLLFVLHYGRQTENIKSPLDESKKI